MAPVPLSAGERAGRRRAAWVLGLVVALALAGRLAFALTRPAAVAGDEVSYLNCARNVVAGHGFVFTPPHAVLSFFLPPAFPAFLVPFAAAFPPDHLARAVAIAHAFLGAATAALAWATARRFANPLAGAVAGVAVAVHPYITYYSSQLLTETLALFFLALFLFLYLKDDAGPARLAAAGAVAALAALTRPVFLYPALAGVAALLLVGRDVPARRRAARAAIMLAAFGVVLAPWAARNYRLSGRPILVTYAMGTVLYQTNAPIAHDPSAPTLWEVAETPAYRAYLKTKPPTDVARELAFQDYLSARARAIIRAHPGEFARLCGRRLLHTFALYPSYASTIPMTPRLKLGTALTASYMTLLFAAALVGFFLLPSRSPRAALFLPTAVVLITAVHVVTIALLRYRLPTDLLLCITASVGVGVSCDKLRRRAAGSPK